MSLYLKYLFPDWKVMSTRVKGGGGLTMGKQSDIF
jgi:hypothetical protein